MRPFTERWKDNILNMGLGTKMVLIYVFSFGIIAFITLFALQITLNVYDEKIYDKSLRELNFFTRQVDDELDKLEQLTYELAIDYTIQSQLSANMELENQADYSFQMSKLRNHLTAEIVREQMIAGAIYTDKRLIRYEVGNQYIPIPEELFQEMLVRFEQAKGAYVYESPSETFPYLVSGRDIRKHLDVSLDYLGSILFISNVGDLIEKNQNQMETKASGLCVYSTGGVIYESEPGLYQSIPDNLENQSYQIIKQSGKKYFICKLTSAKTGWVFVNRFPYSDIYYMNTLIRNGLMIGLILLFLAVSIAVRRLASVIALPLKDLTASMRIVESGDFRKAKESLPPVKRSDEVGVLTQEFSTMLDTITSLIHENYEKQLLLKDTQYQALQAQINPHFLYNTMNSIKWMIRGGKNEEASVMLISLSEMLRSALKKEPDSTIRAELNLLQNYISIQQLRYQRRAIFQIEADEQLDEYEIPHMVLQPLVENAINYGVDNSLHVCKIEITVKARQETIDIVVSDNGPGMSEEELLAVRTFTMQPKGNGIGLKNIAERLDYFFDHQAVFSIDSKAGKGTVIRMEIPKRVRKTANV